MTIPDAILLEDVHKSFGQVHAVRSISAHVPPACIYGFLGPNGAGKTTTLRMILNILAPDQGRIHVLGQPAGGRPPGRIGYLPEDRGLYRKMKVAAVLQYFAALKGLQHHKLDRQVHAWLDRVGLAPWARHKVEDLSRGMHQKLQLAVTLVDDPDLVILDEPFSGLDPVNQDLVESLIRDIRNRGGAVIFSTHVMAHAQRLCDRLLLINHGQVLADGTFAQLRSQTPAHAVTLELESPAPEDHQALARLPGVQAALPVDGRWELTLDPEADPQQLLAVLAQSHRLRSFALKEPTLHEIFVRLVGADHVANP